MQAVRVPPSFALSETASNAVSRAEAATTDVALQDCTSEMRGAGSA
jgi:hypothetical protein